MRFSSSILLAMPIAAFAAEPEVQVEGEESLIDGYKAKFNNFLGSFGGKAATKTPEQVERYSAEHTPAGEALSVLTLNNWKDTLYSSLPEGATTSEEWWIFITGGNKTCNGFCDKAEAAYNTTAIAFAEETETKTPNMALVNCDDQQILCNAWGCGPGSLWVVDMLPAPADIDIHTTRLNLSSVTPEAIAAYIDPAERSKFTEVESIFHPFNSNLAKFDLAIPAGYVVYYFGLVPNWMFMFGLSAISRTMMSNRMQGQGNRGAAPAPPAN